MRFPRQEYWSGVPFHSPRGTSLRRDEPVSPALAGGFYTLSLQGSPSSMLFSHTVMADSVQPTDCSTAGFPVLHCLPERAQTHVLSVGDTIQPLRPLLSPSPHPSSFPASRSFPISWVFASGGQSTGASASVSVLPMNGVQLSLWFNSYIHTWLLEKP